MDVDDAEEHFWYCLQVLSQLATTVWKENHK
jgi:hypothetical protein